MQEIRCPRCGEVFQVDETGYAAIVKQVRDKEFEKEILSREKALLNEKQTAVEMAVTRTEAEKDRIIAQLRAQLEKEAAEKQMEIIRLKNEIQLAKSNTELLIKDAVQEKDTAIMELKNKIQLDNSQWELKEKSINQQHADEIRRKEEEITYYKDFKVRQSTKMIGESLEQHCETEFNKLRATAFPNSYFEKDNDVKTGTKGDYIYREKSEDGVEFISIMFEMKNEMDTTATKHKNEDFFKKLDKDRT